MVGEGGGGRGKHLIVEPVCYKSTFESHENMTVSVGISL